MTLLALLALLAGALVWAAPGSEAQANQAPVVDATVTATDGSVVVAHLDGFLASGYGPIGIASSPPDDPTTITLDGSGTVDTDDGVGDSLCGGCVYRWRIVAGPYDWITPAPVDGTPSNATFKMPSQAFVENLADSDPQKYEITAELTVTDNRGAMASGTVTIYVNQRPTAVIGLYAGLRDPGIVADGDTTTKDLYSVPGVIDGPGEGGNNDNEWDVLGGAYVELDGYASSDPDNVANTAVSYRWDLLTPSTAPRGVNGTAAGGPVFRVGSNTVNGFGDMLRPGSEAVPIITPPGPGRTHTLYYRLTVCDNGNDATPAVCNTANPTLAGRSVVKIVVHDTSAAPDLDITASLTDTSRDRGDASPQATLAELTGVENQFIVSPGSFVVLRARVDNPRRSTGDHTFRWSGASQQSRTPGASNTAKVRIPAGAEHGDTIDVSVTAINNGSRLSTTDAIELVVDANIRPVATGVPANKGIIAPPSALQQRGVPPLSVHSITDGFQNDDDGSTVTLRGVATDADGPPRIVSWVLREAETGATFNETAFPMSEDTRDLNGDGDATDTRVDQDTALQTLIEDWLSPKGDSDDARAMAKAATEALISTALSLMLADAQEPADPLFELENAFTDTVSFEVPNLRNSTPWGPDDAGDRPANDDGIRINRNRGTLLLFSVVDAKSVPSAQFVYVLVNADDDAPEADAGADSQVEAGGFARLNGSASSDPDVLDRVSYRWDYVGATMDPPPGQRSPLTDDEIDGLTGWVLRPATAAEANEAGLVRDSSGKLYKYIVTSDGDIADDAEVDSGIAGLTEGFDPRTAGGKLFGDRTAYPWFDAPEFTGFSNIKLRFRLHVADAAGTDLNGDGDTADTLESLDEADFNVDLSIPKNGSTNQTVTTVNEADLGLDLNKDDGKDDGDADDEGIDLAVNVNSPDKATVGVVESLVRAVDSDEVVVTVSRRYFSGNIPSPDYCLNLSLGGPQTYPFDSPPGDGVADTCALNTTRRAAVARQNALENLAGVFPANFRTAVLRVCEDPEFSQTDWASLGDDPGDLDGDVCETERVSPPPAPADPALAETFFSGVITGQDFCTNFSLGGARAYANDIDGDGVADQCSLATTRREAVARQRALGGFNVSLTPAERTEHAELRLLLALEAKIATGDSDAEQADFPGAGDAGASTRLTDAEQADYARLAVKHVDKLASVVRFSTRLTAAQREPLQFRFDALQAKSVLAARYANALLTECRALGTQDFGDAPSALARDECNPPPATEVQLPSS
ncbi:MAG: hypothetical protein OXF04_04505 [bacterium]|nr:hypothetical protein [bacterium]